MVYLKMVYGDANVEDDFNDMSIARLRIGYDINIGHMMTK